MSTLPLTTTSATRSPGATETSPDARSAPPAGPGTTRSSAAMPALVVGLVCSLLMYLALTAYVLNGLAHRFL